MMICPLMSNFVVPDREPAIHTLECQKEKCAWWTKVKVVGNSADAPTESIAYNCAIVLIANQGGAVMAE